MLVITRRVIARPKENRVPHHGTPGSYYTTRYRAATSKTKITKVAILIVGFRTGWLGRPPRAVAC